MAVSGLLMVMVDRHTKYQPVGLPLALWWSWEERTTRTLGAIVMMMGVVEGGER